MTVRCSGEEKQAMHRSWKDSYVADIVQVGTKGWAALEGSERDRVSRHAHLLHDNAVIYCQQSSRVPSGSLLGLS